MCNIPSDKYFYVLYVYKLTNVCQLIIQDYSCIYLKLKKKKKPLKLTVVLRIVW